MELELHSINGMRNMEVIDVLTGSKLGFIRDLKIDQEKLNHGLGRMKKKKYRGKI